jgi:phage-related protein
VAVIQKVEQLGLQVSQRQEWIKKIDDNLYELRSKAGSNIQRAFYFQKIGNEYLITHGFTKKIQQTPRREIKHAKEMREKYYRGELL